MPAVMARGPWHSQAEGRRPMRSGITCLATLLLALVGSRDPCRRRPGAGGRSAAHDDQESARRPAASFRSPSGCRIRSKPGGTRQAGINLYVALWKGPTEAQLQGADCGRHAGDLRAKPRRAGPPARSDHRRLDARRRARQRPGDRGPHDRQAALWSARPPARIVEDYQRLRAADPDPADHAEPGAGRGQR